MKESHQWCLGLSHPHHPRLPSRGPRVPSNIFDQLQSSVQVPIKTSEVRHQAWLQVQVSLIAPFLAPHSTKTRRQNDIVINYKQGGKMTLSLAVVQVPMTRGTASSSNSCKMFFSIHDQVKQLLQQIIVLFLDGTQQVAPTMPLGKKWAKETSAMRRYTMRQRIGLQLVRALTRRLPLSFHIQNQNVNRRQAKKRSSCSAAFFATSSSSEPLRSPSFVRICVAWSNTRHGKQKLTSRIIILHIRIWQAWLVVYKEQGVCQVSGHQCLHNKVEFRTSSYSCNVSRRCLEIVLNLSVSWPVIHVHLFKHVCGVRKGDATSPKQRQTKGMRKSIGAS